MEEADVGVAGGDVGIAWVEDEGHAEGFPRAAGEVRAVGGGGRGELRAADVGEGDAGFFEDGALGEDARAAAAGVFGALPGVFAEAGGAVFGFEGGADAVLEGKEVGADGGDVGCGRHVDEETRTRKRTRTRTILEGWRGERARC